VRAAVEAGAEVTLARTWFDVDRDFERVLKNRKEGPKLCPHADCCGHAAHGRAIGAANSSPLRVLS
jgi:hypothetical protein